MTILVLDGATIRSEDDFHDQIARHPQSPNDYGRNLDALSEILYDHFTSPVVIVWKNANRARDALGDRFNLILDVFGDANEDWHMAGGSLGVELHDEGQKMNRIAVYCGSATPEDPRYIELAREVGSTLAKRGIGVVYGGGKAGLMGAIAYAALEEGGEVIGVIPQALVDMEVANNDCTELHVVNTMHERKQCFTDLSDGFVTLPGGVGTMDELWEAISWAQLGYHDSPVGLLNAFGYYDGLVEFNRHMAKTGFVRPMHQGIMIVSDTLPDLLEKMANYTPAKTIVQMSVDDL